MSKENLEDLRNQLKAIRDKTTKIEIQLTKDKPSPSPTQLKMPTAYKQTDFFNPSSRSLPPETNFSFVLNPNRFTKKN
jgi:hypothetical protein